MLRIAKEERFQPVLVIRLLKEPTARRGFALRERLQRLGFTNRTSNEAVQLGRSTPSGVSAV
jgi:hypothetical protein